MSDLVQQLGGFVAPDGILDGDGRGREPTPEELERHIVAPGTDAHLPCAIEYQAPWDVLEDGLARHARAQVRALARTGLPVVLRRLSRPKFMMEDDVDARVRASVGYLRDTTAGSVPIAIRQLVIHSATFLENTIAPPGARLSGFDDEIKVYGSTIIYTPWERTTVAPAIVEVLNRCAETWVHGEWVVDIFKRAGVKRVYAIPVAFDPDTSLTSHISAPRGSEKVPSGKRFYAIGKWEPRKNYHALIGAFLQEFSPKERSSLFIKTYEWGSWDGYPSVGESIAYWLAQPEVQANGWTAANHTRLLRVLSDKISDVAIAQLHRDNNLYVTCSHGEAWDMPAFEARSAGNRMVYTGWSGPTDFAGEGDESIWYGLSRAEPVHPGYGWEPEATWASCGVGLIRRALRNAQPPERRVHPPELYPRFGLGPVGAQMAARIQERFPEVYEKLVKVGGFG